MDTIIFKEIEIIKTESGRFLAKYIANCPTCGEFSDVREIRMPGEEEAVF